MGFSALAREFLVASDFFVTHLLSHPARVVSPGLIPPKWGVGGSALLSKKNPQIRSIVWENNYGLAISFVRTYPLLILSYNSEPSSEPRLRRALELALFVKYSCVSYETALLDNQTLILDMCSTALHYC